MANLGLNVLDRTVQETNEWLHQLMEELHTDDRQAAYHTLRSVLFALRDRVRPDLAAHFAAQLPLLVRGIYYEGYRPAEQPKTYRTFEGWADELKSYYGADSPSDTPGAPLNPERLTRAVFTVIAQETGQGLADKMRSALPEDVRTLWPEQPEARTSVGG